jgi:hypothetical protein
MKATVLALALVLAGAANAQTPAPSSAPPNAAAHQAQMMNDLATLLDLTATQKPQVQAILEEGHTQMKQYFEQAKASGTKPDWTAMKAEHQQIEQETITRLTPVLNSSQLAKFQILQKMHQHHGGHRGPPPGATPPSS